MTNEQRIKMQYLGVLNLLCDQSIKMGNDTEAEEFRELTERALEDAQAVIPRIRWRRILHRFEMWLHTDDMEISEEEARA